MNQPNRRGVELVAVGKVGSIGYPIQTMDWIYYNPNNNKLITNQI